MKESQSVVLGCCSKSVSVHSALLLRTVPSSAYVSEVKLEQRQAACVGEEQPDHLPITDLLQKSSNLVKELAVCYMSTAPF